MLCDYNKFIQEHNAIIEASVILHNYKKDNIINSLIFDDLLSKVKMFYSDDKQNLIDYISKSFSKGDSSKIIYEIENNLSILNREINTITRKQNLHLRISKQHFANIGYLSNADIKEDKCLKEIYIDNAKMDSTIK